MKKTLKQLIRAARDFAQPINHGSEPESVRIANAKRVLELELRAQGYGSKAAMIEASARFRNAAAQRAGAADDLIQTENKHVHQ